MNRRRENLAALFAVPLFAAALAAGALIGIVNMGGGPQEGIITSRELIDGQMVARVEASAPYAGSSSDVVVAELVLPTEYHTAETVPVRVLSDWSVEIAEPGMRMPGTGLLGIVAGFGALAGAVMLLNVRGFGFVRGTGELGTMQPSEVREDRGFYWRS